MPIGRLSHAEKGLPSHVVNSTSRALRDLTNESEMIMGVWARSQPYLSAGEHRGVRQADLTRPPHFLTSIRKGNLFRHIYNFSNP